MKLAPGEFFEWDKNRPLNPSIDDLRKWMAWFRGIVLSSSFGIENELILLALADKFGTNDHGAATQAYFELEQQWREEHGLDKKINRAKPIIRKRLLKAEADEIIRQLADYRHLRNLLAHYPCWLEPVNDTELGQTKALKLYIADRRHIWEVDAEQATEWNTLLHSVRVAIENIRREVVGAPALLPDGSLPPTAS